MYIYIYVVFIYLYNMHMCVYIYIYSTTFTVCLCIRSSGHSNTAGQESRPLYGCVYCVFVYVCVFVSLVVVIHGCHLWLRLCYWLITFVMFHKLLDDNDVCMLCCYVCCLEVVMLFACVCLLCTNSSMTMKNLITRSMFRIRTYVL